MFWPRTALAIMLRGDSVSGWLAHFGLKCSSWTAVNSGTSGRSPCTAIGNTDYKSVRDGNCLGSRSFVSIDCVILCCNCSCQVPWTCAYFWESPINEQLTCSQDDLTHDGSSVSQCLYPIGATFRALGTSSGCFRIMVGRGQCLDQKIPNIIFGEPRCIS